MRSSSRLLHKPIFWLGVGFLLSAGFKAWLIFGGWVPFNSDEAVVALMARHIRLGADPVFFYGQAYMGSLDAYLVALSFGLFGEQVWAIRLVQAGLYLGFLITTVLLGKAVFGRWQVGILALLLLAVPSVSLSLYTTASLGGYGEALLIGNLIWLISLRLMRRLNRAEPGEALLFGLLGALIGLGLWGFGLTLVYSIPAVILLLHRSLQCGSQRYFRLKKLILNWLILAGCFLLGSLPWWNYALDNGLSALLGELSGGAIAGVEGLPWASQALRHLVNLLLFGTTVSFGLRPPWSVEWLALALLPIALCSWLLVLIVSVRHLRYMPDRLGIHLLGASSLTLLLAFIFSPFGADPSGRYFLPLAASLALFAAHGIFRLKERFGTWAWGIAGVLMIYQLCGNIQSTIKFPPGLTTQFYSPSQIDHRYDTALIDFLERHGERFGYSNYWVTYPLAFLTEEQIIFAPQLPYHLDLRYTVRDDRLPLYSQLVSESSKTAYITTKNPSLNDLLRLEFTNLGITWQETQIGDYQIFYALSEPVHPAMIGLGKTTE